METVRRASFGTGRGSVNPAAAGLQPSGIREIMALAQSRPGTIRMDIGDPDFSAPPHVTEAAHRAAARGATHYTPSSGIPELREALASKVRTRNGHRVDPGQVVVTQGASQGLFAALSAVLPAGSALLTPDPGWPNYHLMCGLLGIRPVPYPLSPKSGFVPSAALLEEALTPDTRAVLLNSPANPTGAVIGRERLAGILDFAARHDLWVISDECYDEIVYDTRFVSPAAIAPERVISAYSFSKTYAMSGWRVGYLTVPERLAGILAQCQEALLACVAEPAQWAALAALTGSQQAVGTMRETYQRRRDLALAELAGGNLAYSVPGGALFVWVGIAATGLPDRAFALGLLERHGVSVAPGSAFGAAGAGYVRISLTTPDAELAEGCARLAAHAAALTAGRR